MDRATAETRMADVRLGQPGPFLVQRPFLSLLLSLCCVLLFAVSGEGAPVDAGSLLSHRAVLAALAGLGMAAGMAVLAGALPENQAWHWAAAAFILIMALGFGITGRIALYSPSVFLIGFAGAALVGLGRYTGKAALLISLTGIAASALATIALAIWATRSTGAALAEPVQVMLLAGAALGAMTSMLAAESFAGFIATRESSPLAAARVINNFLRYSVVLLLSLPLLMLPVLIVTPQQGLPTLGLAAISIGLAVPGMTILMAVLVSLLGWYRDVSASADRGWFASGLAIASLTSAVRPVMAGSVLVMSGFLALSIAAMAPGMIGAGLENAPGLGPLMIVGGYIGIFAVIMAVTLSFRTGLLVVVPLVIAEMIAWGAGGSLGAELAPYELWGVAIRAMVILVLLRQASLWRAEVSRRARGRELMVRSMAATLPSTAASALLAVIVLSAGGLVSQPLSGPAVSASLYLFGLTVISSLLAHAIAIVLRRVIREWETQAVSAMS